MNCIIVVMTAAAGVHIEPIAARTISDLREPRRIRLSDRIFTGVYR
jgi:hypothetical protein